MEPKQSKSLESLLLTVPVIARQLSPGNSVHTLLKTMARAEVERLFSSTDPEPVDFKPFGRLVFPFRSMGNINSLNLFDLDELILFSFYSQNRTRYNKVLDLGANLGLHSILLAKCGYDVTCFEPDPVHFKILQENLALNNLPSVKTVNAAISTMVGETKFVRVLGNTTGSHIAGAKADPYGALEYITVKTVDFRTLLDGIDLVKIDIEGHEREVLLTTERKHWEKTDGLIEIENAVNGKILLDHFRRLEINVFSQKINWGRVQKAEEMPEGYREGLVFISAKASMPW